VAKPLKVNVCCSDGARGFLVQSLNDLRRAPLGFYRWDTLIPGAQLL
jgi:hypothetical protein